MKRHYGLVSVSVLVSATLLVGWMILSVQTKHALASDLKPTAIVAAHHKPAEVVRPAPLDSADDKRASAEVSKPEPVQPKGFFRDMNRMLDLFSFQKKIEPEQVAEAKAAQ